MSQITKNILMIKPSSFAYNVDTAKDNFFQKIEDNLSSDQIQSSALDEFSNMCSILKENGINVVVMENEKDTWKLMITMATLKMVDSSTQYCFPHNS